MSKLYKISTDAKKVDEAIASKHLVLPLSKILGVVRDEDGEVLDENQPLLKEGSYFVKFIKEEKSVNYTQDSITYTFKCDVKEKRLPYEFKTHIRAVEETLFGEKNLGVIIDSDFIFADSNLEYYIDFTDKVVYTVDNDDIETEAEVLDDVNVLLLDPRTVAYHTEYPTEKDDWSEALGIEKPEEPEEPKEEPKEDPKPEVKPEVKPSAKSEGKCDKPAKSKKSKIVSICIGAAIGIVIAVVIAYHKYDAICSYFK